MKALVIGVSKNKTQILFAGDRAEARKRYNDYKPRVAITEIQLWDSAKGKVKSKQVTPPTKGKKDDRGIQ